MPRGRPQVLVQDTNDKALTTRYIDDLAPRGQRGLSRDARHQEVPVDNEESTQSRVNVLNLTQLQMSWKDNAIQIRAEMTQDGIQMDINFPYTQNDHSQQDKFIEDAINDLKISGGQARQLVDQIDEYWNQGQLQTHPLS